MKITRTEVVIDPNELTGVYSRSPGKVRTLDAEGKVLKCREATEKEAFNEQWMQRLESAFAGVQSSLGDLLLQTRR